MSWILSMYFSTIFLNTLIINALLLNYENYLITSSVHNTTTKKYIFLSKRLFTQQSKNYLKYILQDYVSKQYMIMTEYCTLILPNLFYRDKERNQKTHWVTTFHLCSSPDATHSAALLRDHEDIFNSCNVRKLHYFTGILICLLEKNYLKIWHCATNRILLL